MQKPIAKTIKNKTPHLIFEIENGLENKHMKVAVIDNYDSFTYNLVHYLEDLNCEVTVFRND